MTARAACEMPTGADAHLLSRVTHGWDDAAAEAILRTCPWSAGPLLVEAVPADEPTGLHIPEEMG
jgi:hypothetical protein